ncbi:MAG TPA: sulfurtransferase [Vicinamibacterales bacterium]|nr:sulfurtransferase [Vicinamibacterales bacterium]
MFRTLIDPATLSKHTTDASFVVIDCRFDLADPAKGEQLYLESHIPGARYAHLDRDLSGEKTRVGGRHPLPTAQQMRDRFGALGIDASKQVIVYDADSGMHASRLWWMLRFMGHDAVALFDGGFARWLREGRPVASGPENARSATFTGTPQEAGRLDAESVAAGLDDPTRVLVDARAETRFRGENETLDKAAGHIPGARNHFFQHNLSDDKTFKSADELRAQWQRLLGGAPPEQVVMYCGSGVTACHNLLAMEHAGLGGARLYPGSWSDWSSDPNRPIATGA